MPIYEYACQNCEHQFDVLQKMIDDPLTVCPECGEPRLKKLLSAPNFRLKGGGWYETDFKKDNQRNVHDSGDGEKPKADAKDKGDGAKKSDDKTPKDSKPKAGKSGGKESGSGTKAADAG